MKIDFIGSYVTVDRFRGDTAGSSPPASVLVAADIRPLSFSVSVSVLIHELRNEDRIDRSVW